MPKSRVRKRPVYTPPASQSKRKKASPAWLVPTMLACLILGLAWIALYYVTNGGPSWLSALSGWNLVCGFALIVVGVILATNWR